MEVSLEQQEIKALEDYHKRLARDNRVLILECH